MKYHIRPLLRLVSTLALFGGMFILLLLGAAQSPATSSAQAAPDTPPPATLANAIGVPGAPASISLADLPPTVITRDDQGYTTFSVDWSAINWCVPVSTLRYPLNLGGNDPTTMSDASLRITYNHGSFTPPENIVDPTWDVAWNGDPPKFWQDVGAISGPLSSEYKIWNTETLTVDSDMLIDGENNLWLRQRDTYPQEPGCSTCASTCVEIDRVELRVAQEFVISSFTPLPDTQNVRLDQRTKSEIRVRFSTLPDPKSLTSETFQVFYMDTRLDPVYVAGSVQRITPTEYAFVPDRPLRDGIRYTAQIWGKTEALDYSREQWVTDIGGNPLEVGNLWSFWTLPELKVTLVPVQTVEIPWLIANKPTVLKTYVRWDEKPDVFKYDQVYAVELYDLSLTWTAIGSAQKEQVSWRQDDNTWKPLYADSKGLRKREYLTFTEARASYSKSEKMRALDSINYFDFVPLEQGDYMLRAQATLLDSQGQRQNYADVVNLNVVGSRTLRPLIKAVAVGADYGKIGTVDLSEPISNALATIRGFFPLAHVTWPAAPTAMPYYNPTTSLWLWNWTTEPAWDFPQSYLLSELSQICTLSTDCDVAIGLVRAKWLNDAIGLEETGTPRAALVLNSGDAAYRFVAAHELGHTLVNFDHNTQLPADDGFEIRTRDDRRDSVMRITPLTTRLWDFMDPMPKVEGTDDFWITRLHYNQLYSALNKNTVAVSSAADDQLLLASGEIVEPTGTVSLQPWYTVASNRWIEPVAGLYQIVFLDGAGQEIAGYSRDFAARTPQNPGDPALFSLALRYPSATARIQIRRGADTTLLHELTPASSAPTLSIAAPPTTVSGPQPLSWSSSASAYAIQISTDGGTTWEALAVNVSAPNYTLNSTALPNTTQALVRVLATNGLRTAEATSAPFTIANPPTVAYTIPAAGAQGVNIGQPVSIGFRDPMNPASLNGTTVSLSDLSGVVPADLSYDPASHELTLTPRMALADATIYTLRVTTGVRDTGDRALEADVVVSFTTAVRRLPPQLLAHSPAPGAVAVALHSGVSVIWDTAINSTTLSTDSFTLTTAAGTPVSGAVSYDAASRSASFTPAAALAPATTYLVTLKAGIADLVGNLTAGDEGWSFRTGRLAGQDLAFSGAFADAGDDSNRDGRFEQLVIRVGVRVPAAGNYGLSGRLLDQAGATVVLGDTSVDLPGGTSFIRLAFSGTAIGGHGTDGPYTLTDLTLYQAIGTGTARKPGATTLAGQSYATFAYAAAQFTTPLRLSGLPDLNLLPGQPLNPPLNLRDFAWHQSLPVTSLRYELAANPVRSAGVSLSSDGILSVAPDPDWIGSTHVTVRVSDGTAAALASIPLRIGWPSQLNLPLVTNHLSAFTTSDRNNWYTPVNEGFEGDMAWSRWSSISIPPGGWYQWGSRDCAAFSGTKSAWPFGAGETGDLLPCGASYPNTLNSSMTLGYPINLKYTARAELRMKVWTDLPPGDQICAMVATGDLNRDTIWQAPYEGICRSGKSNGWEDLVLDLANVPNLGSLLGQEKVWMSVRFIADAQGTRPIGAYVDDVQVRLCPQGLTCQ